MAAGGADEPAHGAAPVASPAGPPTLARLWGRGLVVLVLNTAIAGMVMATGLARGGAAEEIAFSQAIGLSIWLTVEGVAALPLRPKRRVAGYGVAIGVGSLAGASLGAGLVRGEPWAGIWASGTFLRALPIGLIFGVVITGLLMAGWRAARAESALVQRERRLAQAEQARLQARLELLQGQMAPHFLMNTLATIAGLIDREPQRARALVDDLSDLLRRTLAHSQAETAPLGDELDLIADYLAIMQARLGPRLAYRIAADEAVRRRPVPPLVVQPLVENAVKHGIEPVPAGGTISVSAAAATGGIAITVAQDGAAPGTGAPGTGVGHGNLRARLQALYGAAAELRLEAEPDGGTAAQLHLPEAQG